MPCRRLIILVLLVCTSTAQADIAYQNVSDTAGVTATHSGNIYSCGQAVADVNGDQWLDLFVTGHEDSNHLYLNLGDGSFEESPHSGQLNPAGSDCGPVAFGDFNNDARPDLYMTCMGSNFLFRNDGITGFTDVTDSAGVDQLGRSQAVAWGDINADGWLDLYVGYYPLTDPPNPPDPEADCPFDCLFLNDGDGTFTSISNLLDEDELAKTAFAANFTDIDNDGDLDLYVVNDRFDGNTLWRNDGPGCGGWCLTNVAEATGADVPVEGMGIAVGDTDADGDLDLYFSSTPEQGQIYLENQLSDSGTLQFINATEASGMGYHAMGWATHFLDMDNDRWLDAYLAVMNDLPLSDRVYQNVPGQIQFDDISIFSGVSDEAETLGASQWDYDRDGRQDLVTCNINEGYELYRNISADGGDWLVVELIGGGSVNRDAIGSRVTVTSGDGLKQIREVTSGQGRAGNSMFAVHFGLGDQPVMTLRVDWPDGTETLVEAPAVNRYLRLYHQDAQLDFSNGYE